MIFLIPREGNHMGQCKILFIVLMGVLSCCEAVEPFIIGIVGGTGSGKTTLAEKIEAAFPEQTVLIYEDRYYRDLSHLSAEERAVRNFDHPDAIEFELLKQHLIDLKEGKAVAMPEYSFHTHSRLPYAQTVQPRPIVVVEGILLFAVPEIRDLFDFKIFVFVDDDIRLLRRMERDMKERSRDFNSVRDQYLATVKPMHDAFVEPSQRFADVIIPTEHHNDRGFSMIVSKIKDELGLQNLVRNETKRRAKELDNSDYFGMLFP